MSISQRLFSDALRDMQRAMAVFEQPLYDVSRRALAAGPTTSFFNDHQGIRYPTTDMVETPEAYELHAELPGYDKKDIKIELADDQHTLVLSGSVKKEHEVKSATPAEDKEETPKKDTDSKAQEGQLVTKKDEDSQVAKADTNKSTWLVKERVSGSFTRSFSLPTPVDASSIKASYDNGVLKVVVPKSAKKESKQINID